MATKNKNTAESLHDRYVGKRALLSVDLSLAVQVSISDAREKFGRVDVLVSPVAGSGEKWVSADRVSAVA